MVSTGPDETTMTRGRRRRRRFAVALLVRLFVAVEPVDHRIAFLRARRTEAARPDKAGRTQHLAGMGEVADVGCGLLPGPRQRNQEQGSAHRLECTASAGYLPKYGGGSGTAAPSLRGSDAP